MRDPTTGKPLMYIENEQIAEYRNMGLNKGAFAQVMIGKCSACKHLHRGNWRCKESGRSIGKKASTFTCCNLYAERKA